MENNKGNSDNISKCGTAGIDSVNDGIFSKKNTESSRQNISFTFTNKRNKTLVGNKLSEEETSAENTEDFVVSVEDRQVKSTKPKEEKRDLVIPLIKKNTWRFPNSKPIESSASIHGDEPPSGETLLNQMAVKELLQETSRENEKWENRTIPNETVMIPLIMQNKVPEGFETDDKMDVSLRPDVSTIEDYEKVPVDAFGLAMLRGMGWKPGEAIGGKNKKCVTPVEVVLRPKGLGLGADKQVLKKYQKENQEEKLVLVKGSYILVQQGSHKGLYGQVEGLDDENARVIVKITGDDKCVTLPEFYVEVVSKKEFQKESKVINKSAYDKYAKTHEEKKKDWTEQKSNERNHHDYRSSKRRDESSDYANDSGGNTKSSHHHKKKRKHSKERSEKSCSIHNSQEQSESWVSAQLKVRVIDNQYKKGKYFNHKRAFEEYESSKGIEFTGVVLANSSIDIVLHDTYYVIAHFHYVLSYRSSICYHADVQPSMLETVIPRSEPGYIMIVQGKYKGQLGVILKKNKVNCVATVQLLLDRQKVLKLEYDSICEYVGDVSQFD